MIKNDELYHYGVKGMKWGVRKKREKMGNFSLKKSKVMLGKRQLYYINGQIKTEIKLQNLKLGIGGMERTLVI